MQYLHLKKPLKSATQDNKDAFNVRNCKDKEAKKKVEGSIIPSSA